MKGCRHKRLNKSECKYKCCKVKVGVSAADNLLDDALVLQEELKMRGDEAERREDYKPTIQLYGRAVYLYGNEDCFSSLISSFETESAVVYSEEEKQLLQERINGDDAEATFLVAYLLFRGKGGYSKDWEAALQLFSRATSLGHAYAMFWSARCLRYGYGVERDEAAARRMYIQAAAAGCGRACLGAAFMLHLGHGGPKDFHLAALYYQRAISLNYETSYMKFCLDELKEDHPMDAAPWSRWAAEPEVHSLVPPRVHAAMRTWSLVAKRSPLPKDLHPIVISYISTRNGW